MPLTRARPIAAPRAAVTAPRGGVLALALAAALLASCQPSVKVEAPDKPITINLNVKLDAEVRVKLEETAEEDIQQNPDIF
jgi:hypothetical protein